MTDLNDVAEQIEAVTEEAEQEAEQQIEQAQETAAAIIENAQHEAERIMDAAYIRSLEDRIRDLEAKTMAPEPAVITVDTEGSEPDPEPEPEPDPEPETVTADVGPGETVELPPTEDMPETGGEPDERDIAPRNRNSHWWYRTP